MAALFKAKRGRIAAGASPAGRIRYVRAMSEAGNPVTSISDGTEKVGAIIARWENPAARNE
ncbi:MAG: hypothetical protein OXM58_15330 [Rhodospirillaceae bacterium]|nr:hypothetical protein [Rhodospirillaceae bacterium]MDE0619648.1 hypothetical protein [Rhodospirillaceae bacterium]